MAELRKLIPAGHEATSEARRTIVRFAASWFDDEVLAEIQLAVGEALANAAEHGFRPGTQIEIRCTCDGHALIVDIRDAGTGFRPPRRRKTAPASGAPRGYGITIMRTLMDRVRYSHNGTRVRLTRFVRPARSATLGEELA